jgi:hypothetical protein
MLSRVVVDDDRVRVCTAAEAAKEEAPLAKAETKEVVEADKR